ncbi:MAG TPA: serine/threonine-protein kinase [Kofleriaceae bacterium]|nr:serine/threonine-protein kinase [Kofleriaceae bacterium]
MLDGRYKITRKLGEGGMGEVYAAEHVHIEKRFAIKLLRPEIVSNAEAVQRFRQEARSASSIGHRNIIAIEDFGQLPDGRIYMCMELLNGAALNDLIQTPIAVDRLLNILIQTGHGLAAAHAKGIIHRDMKPENIFVTIGPNGEDIPKLLDFGIAKVAGNDAQNHLTRTGTIFGTPFYMAPEQALGNPVDARTDIYAMGVIMYEVFAGSLPFQGDSFMGILTQHITTEPEPVAQRAAKAGRQLPMGLADIITRCMQKNPAQRFGSMDELVNALIQLYRGIAGPGMSTYMEAFPVSARHAAPTPAPLTGPVLAAHAPTQLPSGMHGHGTGPVAVQPGGSGPNVMPMMPGASAPELYPGQSAPFVPKKKSSAGLVIAILAVVIVGGGIAAFVVASGGGGGGGSGAGSQVAGADDAGASGSGEPAAADAGKVATVADAAVPVVADAGEVAMVDAGGEPPKQLDAAVDIPTTVDILIKSKYHPSFEVWENDKKLFDGPDNLPVVAGESRTITIKVRGYKDKTFTVSSEAKGRKLEFKLDRIPGQGTGPGSGSQAKPPPADPGCRNVVVDPSSTACRKQYCQFHPDDLRCGAE